MARLDEIPFSTSAYLADTQHLSLAQHGAYLLILMTMWRAGGWIPDDDRVLANICKSTITKWRKIAADVRALLISKDGKLSQKRLLSGIENETKRFSKNAENGKAGGIAKSLKSKEPTLATATISPPQLPPVRQPVATIPNESASYTSSFLESSSDSQEGKKEGRKKTRGSVLNENWRPPDAEIVYGKSVLGLTDAQIDAAAERMKRWAIANAHRAVARKSNWGMTFRNWLDKEVNENGSNWKNGGGDSREGKAPARRGFAAYALEQARRAAGDS